MTARAQKVLFEEEQAFRQPWLWALLAGTLLLLIIVLGFVILQPPKEDSVLPAVAGLALGIVVQVGVALLLYTMRLSVRLDAAGLHIRFFPLVKKSISPDEIARWEVRTYRPILEYGGWGVRFGWKGMAYNVSGNRGVQLVLANGKRLLIGSQCPEELAAAISRAKQKDD